MNKYIPERFDIIFLDFEPKKAKEIGKPTDYGSIYAATFADLDGHQWNIFHMGSKKSS